MFSEVVPLVRLPKNLSYFDYEIPQDIEGQIKIGQMVIIPFRGKKVRGVIKKIKDSAAKINAPIKKIIKILSDDPVIDKIRLELLGWMAGYYLSSLPLILKTFLPEPPLRKIREASPKVYPPKQLSVSKSDIGKIKESLALLSNNKKFSLLRFANWRNKTAVLLKCTEKIVTQGKGVLIIEPQVPDVLNILPYFINLSLGGVAVLHGEMSKTEYWREWQKIKSGKSKIVIGTRSALCAPLDRLGLLIVDNEEASDFKQSDQNPRYDARDAVLKISEITGAKVIFTSQAPRPETYFLAENRPDGQYLQSGQKFPSPAVIVDMGEEMKNKNFSSLSEKMKEGISHALLKKQKIILLLNRRGSSTLALCRDCNYIFRCKKCKNPLTCHENECNLPSKFICHNCGREEPVSLKCPHCHGTSIKYTGIGTQAVEREIKKIFPEKKVLRIDKDAEIAELEKRIASADIFIGTNFFTRNYLAQVSGVGLVGIISADTMFYRPDFRSGEKTFSWITGIINLAHDAQSKIIIQTFFPNNFVIRSITNNNPEEFYGEELDNRMTLGYPPFNRLAKLSYANPKEEICAKEASDLYGKIKKSLFQLAEISADEKPKLEGKKFFSKVVLKFPEEAEKKVKDTLKKIIPDEWTIDIDPESLL